MPNGILPTPFFPFLKSLLVLWTLRQQSTVPFQSACFPFYQSLMDVDQIHCANNSAMTEDPSGDLPYCSQCFKSLLHMRYPFLASCNHLFCLNCTNHLIRNETLVCPLDNTETPSGLMVLSEALKTMSRKYSLEKASGELERINKEAQAAINLKLVRCRHQTCTRPGCPYVHSAALENASTYLHSMGVASPSVHSPATPMEQVSPYVRSILPAIEHARYFEAQEPPLQLSYMDLEEDDERELLRSYLDLTVSRLYH